MILISQRKDTHEALIPYSEKLNDMEHVMDIVKLNDFNLSKKGHA